MNITTHAAQRFLERVICKPEYTSRDISMAKEYLTKTFKNVVATSAAKRFALPGFESQFYVVHKQNTVITIIPKDKN